MSTAPLQSTMDQFLGGQLAVAQPVHGYRAGLDAVVLAAACPAIAGAAAKCLDCGAGVGVAGLALARRVGDARVTLIEISPDLATLALANAASNGLGDRVVVLQGDVTAPLSRIEVLAQQQGRFDHVIINPPYYGHGAGTRARAELKDGAHAMPEGDLAAWLRFAAAMAANGGSLTIVHRPDALPELLAAIGRRFGRIWVMPLHSRPGEPASRILVQAIKGSRAPMQLLAGRILHRDGDHGFTGEFESVLRSGTALRWNND